MIINVNNTKLFYEKTGRGKPLILLHGNGEDHHIFDKLTLKLKNDFEVYGIDSRNHGKSEKTDDYSYNTMAEDVHAFIRALELEPVNIIGFSDGAIITLFLAMHHEEVISKMALLGINLKPSDFIGENYQYIVDTYKETKDPLFKLMMEQPNIELDDIRNIDIETFIVAGENDLFKPELYQNLLDVLPNSILKIMEGHDHSSYIKDEDIMYFEFERFFK